MIIDESVDPSVAALGATVPAGDFRLHMTGSEWFTSIPGGLNRYFTDLYRALADRPDVDVSASAFGNPEPGGQSWGAGGGATWRRARIAFGDRTSLPRRGIYDRHFCLYGPSSIDLRSRRCALVIHFHGPWASESRIAGSTEGSARVKYWIERARYHGADRYVVLSSAFRDLLAGTYRVPESRIQIIPPGVDLERFRPSQQSPTATVLCVRRLERRMGIHILLRCWSEVTAAHPDARLVIVGTGSAEGELRAQARKSDLARTVSFEGNATDARLTELYDQAALTVVPTVALEGFGLIALESLAVGRAPIVTNCGGLPESVHGLDPSLVVPVHDVGALAQRIIDGLNGQVPSPGECRAHAESFSWEAAAARHVAMYRELL